MTTTNSKGQFGKFRSFIWPIYRHEYLKFIPMFLIFFLISFNYNILRATKDTLIVTAPSSGAETIPFIKVWVMLPLAVVMTFIFTKLSHKYKQEKVFYLMLSIFIGFFILFISLLYPFREHLHPSLLADKLEYYLPAGLSGLIALFRNWILTLFYVMSELWGTIILTVSFWGIANEITSVNEAKRFYALFGVGANIASIIAGQVAILLSSNLYNPRFFFGNNSWEQTVLYLNGMVIIIGFLIMVIFYTFSKKVPRNKITPSGKTKMSLKKSLLYLTKSKYLIHIAVIVLSYNIGINLVEIIWKNQVKQLYPNPSDYNIYMGQIMIVMGTLATILALFVTGNMLRKFSWSFNALITPLIMLITSVCFFSSCFFKGNFFHLIASFLGISPLMLSVFFGSMQNCISKASKYTLFDATKEISFIPLSKDYKLKGKAAIDGVGSRIGKSGGALIHQILLLLFSSLAITSPYIAIIFLIIIAVWTSSILALGKQFTSLISQEKILSDTDLLLDESITSPKGEFTS